MEVYNKDKLNYRLMELEQEERNLERFLNDNASSLEQEDVEDLKNDLIAIRSEKGQISNLMSGGFY